MTTTLRRAALLALALVATACSDQAPTAPATPTPQPNALLSGLLGGLGSKTTLEQQKARELSRVKTVALLSGVTYTALKPVWDVGTPITDLLGLPLLQCSPLPYDADVKIVGREGGVLRVGPHTLTIPSGALREPTVITAEAEVGFVRTVKFSPHGLKFDRPAKLDLSYVGCRTSATDRPTISYIDGELTILEWLNTTVLSGDVVRGDVWHFSRYAASRSIYATSW
jgi:hypothetical protein